jgi:hypothetical protein
MELHVNDRDVVTTVARPRPEQRRQRDVPRCWICRGVVHPDAATIAPTVCAPCYEALREHWR